MWRSGTLGFTPILEGQLADDWIDFRTGHKRVHYTLTEADRLSPSQKAMLRAMSEPYADHHTIDGDIFDEVTDATLSDTGTLRQALEAVQGFCGKPSLARVYAAINSTGQSRP